MNEMIFDICYFVLFMSGFLLLICLGDVVFEIAYNHMPAFKKWVNAVIGEDI